MCVFSSSWTLEVLLTCLAADLVELRALSGMAVIGSGGCGTDGTWQGFALQHHGGCKAEAVEQ